MTIEQRTPAKRIHRGTLLTTAVLLGLGASLVSCGAQDQPLAATTAPAVTQPSTGETSEAVPTEVTPSAVETTKSTPQDTPLCTAASLTGALDSTGGGAAGSIFMSLVLSNSSGAACILDGYPGVSLVPAGSAVFVGAPAVRNAKLPSSGPITLAPGKSATATLRYTQADNYQDCQRVETGAVLVYPPSAKDSLEIPRELTACSNAEIPLLTIGAFQP
ncbi:DUF4232 domain-containing protein [Arthrobacter psychrolactophilus]